MTPKSHTNWIGDPQGPRNQKNVIHVKKAKLVNIDYHMNQTLQSLMKI